MLKPPFCFRSIIDYPLRSLIFLDLADENHVFIPLMIFHRTDPAPLGLPHHPTTLRGKRRWVNWPQLWPLCRPYIDPPVENRIPMDCDNPQ